MENNTRKPFLTFNAGVNEKGAAYAFHLEGNVARVPVFKEAENDKKGFCSFGIGVGRNPWLLLGDEAVKEQSKNTRCNEDKPFVEVIVFDPLAATLKDVIDKGSKVAVCGRPEKQSYTKDGETVEYVRLIADSIYPLSCKATAGGKPTANVTARQQVYTRKDNTEGVNNMALLLGGTIKETYAVRTYNERPVVSFDIELALPALKMLAIVDGSYQKNADYGKNKTVRCSVWGNRALNLGKVLLPGNTLAVTGVPTKNTYNGTDYVNMTVQEFSVLSWDGSNNAKNDAAPAATAEQATTKNAAPVDIPEEPANLLDEDFTTMDLPF